MSIVPSKCIQNPSPTSWLLQCSTSGGTTHGSGDVNSAPKVLHCTACRLYVPALVSPVLKPQSPQTFLPWLLCFCPLIVYSQGSSHIKCQWVWSLFHRGPQWILTSPRVKVELCNDLWGLTSSALSPGTSLTLLTLFQPWWCLCGFLNILDAVLPRGLCHLPL